MLPSTMDKFFTSWQRPHSFTTERSRSVPMRVAFLLHDVFGIGFDEIAVTIQRSPAACRQLAARARDHVREARPRFQVDKQRGLEIASAFFAASRNSDITALRAMLAADISCLRTAAASGPQRRNLSSASIMSSRYTTRWQ